MARSVFDIGGVDDGASSSTSSVGSAGQPVSSVGSAGQPVSYLKDAPKPDSGVSYLKDTPKTTPKPDSGTSQFRAGGATSQVSQPPKPQVSHRPYVSQAPQVSYISQQPPRQPTSQLSQSQLSQQRQRVSYVDQPIRNRDYQKLRMSGRDVYAPREVSVKVVDRFPGPDTRYFMTDREGTPSHISKTPFSIYPSRFQLDRPKYGQQDTSSYLTDYVEQKEPELGLTGLDASLKRAEGVQVFDEMFRDPGKAAGALWYQGISSTKDLAGWAEESKTKRHKQIDYLEKSFSAEQPNGGYVFTQLKKTAVPVFGLGAKGLLSVYYDVFTLPKIGAYDTQKVLGESPKVVADVSKASYDFLTEGRDYYAITRHVTPAIGDIVKQSSPDFSKVLDNPYEAPYEISKPVAPVLTLAGTTAVAGAVAAPGYIKEQGPALISSYILFGAASKVLAGPYDEIARALKGPGDDMFKTIKPIKRNRPFIDVYDDFLPSDIKRYDVSKLPKGYYEPPLFVKTPKKFRDPSRFIKDFDDISDDLVDQMKELEISLSSKNVAKNLKLDKQKSIIEDLPGAYPTDSFKTYFDIAKTGKFKGGRMKPILPELKGVDDLVWSTKQIKDKKSVSIQIEKVIPDNTWFEVAKTPKMTGKSMKPILSDLTGLTEAQTNALMKPLTEKTTKIVSKTQMFDKTWSPDLQALIYAGTKRDTSRTNEMMETEYMSKQFAPTDRMFPTQIDSKQKYRMKQIQLPTSIVDFTIPKTESVRTKELSKLVQSNFQPLKFKRGVSEASQLKELQKTFSLQGTHLFQGTNTLTGTQTLTHQMLGESTDTLQRTRTQYKYDPWEQPKTRRVFPLPDFKLEDESRKRYRKPRVNYGLPKHVYTPSVGAIELGITASKAPSIVGFRTRPVIRRKKRKPKHTSGRRKYKTKRRKKK